MKMLSEEVHQKLNNDALIRERDEWFSRLSDLFENRPNAYNARHVFTLDGFVPRPVNERQAYYEPEAWINACLELAAALPPFTGQRFAPVCVEYPIYGVHFIDKVLGANVFNLQGDSEEQDVFQWNASYLTTPVGSLQMPDLDSNETWALAKRAAMAFLEADVKLPLYGMPTLASPLNILLNLYGQEALVAMCDDEEAVMHDLRIITDVIGAMHKWHREHIPEAQLQPVISWNRTQPPGFGQICGCTTQLISGDFYRKFAAPLDDELLAIYPHGGMIHLCGSHTQHLNCFRDMPHLRAVQVNDRAAEDLKAYLEGLREDQIIYVNPCPGMPAEEAVRLSGGKRIVLAAAIDAPEMPKEE